LTGFNSLCQTYAKTLGVSILLGLTLLMPIAAGSPTMEIATIYSLVFLEGNTLVGIAPVTPHKASTGVLVVLDEDSPVWLEKLAKCESGDRWDIRVWDTGSYSFGGLQFKLKTFWHYGVEYGILPKDLPLEEAENRIYEKETQEAIAKKMVADGLWYHWKKCGLLIGLNKI